MAGSFGDLDAVYARLETDRAVGPFFAEAVLAARRVILPLRDVEAGQDALIDEVMRIINGSSSYDPRSLRLVPYLRMVVRRKVANHLRAEKRRRERQGKAVQLGVTPSGVA
ncbi:MAG: hypothetical protein AAF916_12335, partial [Planctomycetota bacterium]